MKKQIIVSCFAAGGVFVLITDAQTALNAGQEAVQLCIRVIVPSLLPFFVLINLLNSAILGCHMGILTPIERMLHLPSGGGAFYLSGLLGGYPTGAQQVQSAWKKGVLDKHNAQRMLAFCSNAGPAFIFGIVGAMFSDSKIPWLIWGVHILSSFLVGWVYPKAEHTEIEACHQRVSVSESLKKSVAVMGYVCGWVILFRVLAAFCNRWFLWCFSTELQVLLISVLELSNGCVSLDLIQNENTRVMIATCAVNFGGLCVLMQTQSVTAGLKVRDYLRGKLLQTVFAVLLTQLWLFLR